MITYVFPGQGAQNKGMGRTLFDEFKELTAQADQILGYSIKELCLNDPNLTLGLTQYTQPALYIVNALTYLEKIKEGEERPNFVAGHSLGEYDALFAAGAFDFITGLKLVKKRGELMGRAVGGAMAAVIGLNQEQMAEMLEQNQLQSIDIANLNSPFQIVISGPQNDIKKARVIFEEAKGVKLFTILKTSGAFHSRYMREAQQEYEVFLNQVQFSNLTIPVISNVYARPYQQPDIWQNLIDQMTSPVKWTESIRYLMSCGEMTFQEIGPGRILTGLIQRIQKEAEPLIVSNAEIEGNLKVARVSAQIDAENDRDSVIYEDKSEGRFLGQEVVESTIKEDSVSSLGKVVTGVIKNVQGKAKNLVSSAEESIIKATNATKDSKGKLKRVPKKVWLILPSELGSPDFKNDYNLEYAYITGGMYRGIASKEMVVAMGKAGMMGFWGSGGLGLPEIESAIQFIRAELSEGQTYGMNLVHNLNDPEMEEKTVTLFLKYGVKKIEAAAFLSITPALVIYRAKGLARDKSENVFTTNKIIAKVSRPEVAEAFLSSAPERIVLKLLEENKITAEETALLKEVPMADDICAEADSGGHTDGAVAYALLPAMIRLRDKMMKKYQYHKQIRVGAAGGIGTPEAAAAAFIMGADFIVTGSINQCTVEADTSDTVKDLLQQMNVQDTEYAPAGDMFELGAKVQVLKKGLFFPARANKLFELYRQYNSLDEIDEKTKAQIQEKYFKCSFEDVYKDVKAYFPAHEIEKAELNPKHKMALIFRWYFGYTTRLALNGSEESKVDYQIHCGPALGAFNQWVKGAELENWRNRHVDKIGLKLMHEAAELLSQRMNTLQMTGSK